MIRTKTNMKSNTYFGFNANKQYGICTGCSRNCPKSTPLEISGSGDILQMILQNSNIGTSFGSDQNSLSLGMLDAFEEICGKSIFCG
jgi:hypothetical protein